MKKIILDTDIGGDCDDVGALVLLKSLILAKKVDLLCVTSCTTLEGAAPTIAAVLNEYGLTIPIGVMQGEQFMVGGLFDIYAHTIMIETKKEPATMEAVGLLRKTLASSPEKVTVIAIGPQRNLKNLLNSQPDAYSPLDGRALVREKVEELVIMGARFTKEKIYFRSLFELKTEWNIIQDIDAAICVSENWDSPIVYSPMELGYNLYTGRKLPEGGIAKRCYHIRHLHECSLGDDSHPDLRESWDPCAAYYGAVGVGNLFALSDYGTVTFNAEGASVFRPGEGKHRILSAAADNSTIEEALDALMN